MTAPVDPSLTAAFIQADHTSVGSNLPVTRIVIHGTVSRTFIGGAVSVAGYFTSPLSGGSAHYVVDPATVVQCVAEETIAWHAPPNQGSLGIELCDLVDYSEAQSYDWARFPNEAAWNARWDLPDFDNMLLLGAALTRELATKYSVPLTEIGPSNLLAGAWGLCGHIDVSNAWHQSDHHDPGVTFPWGRFMSYVTNPPTPTPAVPTPVQEWFDMSPIPQTDLDAIASAVLNGAVVKRDGRGNAVPKDGTSLASQGGFGSAAFYQLQAQSLSIAALTAAVTALAKQPDLTAAQVQQIVTTAVATALPPALPVPTP